MQTFVDFFSNILQSDIDHTIYYLTEIRSPFYTLVFRRFLLKFIVIKLINNLKYVKSHMELLLRHGRVFESEFLVKNELYKKRII